MVPHFRNALTEHLQAETAKFKPLLATELFKHTAEFTTRNFHNLATLFTDHMQVVGNAV